MPLAAYYATARHRLNETTDKNMEQLIECGGVDAILTNHIAYAIFLRFTLDESCSESLLCYAELKKYRRLCPVWSRRESYNFIRCICKLFLVEGSLLEINCHPKWKARAVDIICKPKQFCADADEWKDLEAELQALLRSIIDRFQRSSLWDTLIVIEEMNDDNQKRRHVADHLAAFFHNLSSHAWSSRGSEMKVILSFVCKFIRTKLEIIDLEYLNLTENLELPAKPSITPQSKLHSTARRKKCRILRWIRCGLAKSL